MNETDDMQMNRHALVTDHQQEGSFCKFKYLVSLILLFPGSPQPFLIFSFLLKIIFLYLSLK